MHSVEMQIHADSKAKLLWMTLHYGPTPTVVRSVSEIPCHVFIW